MSPDEVKRLVQELQVYQAELEAQNEELRETQAALEEVRDRYATLFDFSPVGYLFLTEEDQIREVNSRFCQLVGLTRKQLLHQPFIQFIAPDYQVAYRRHLNTLPEIGNPHLSEVLQLRNATFSSRIRLESCRETLAQSSQVKGIRMAVLNVEQQEQAQEALRKSHEEVEQRKRELQFLTEQLIRGQEEERARISHELHENVCQRLVALQMQLHHVLSPLPKSAYQKMIINLAEITDIIRQLSHQYTSSTLQDLGLETALQTLTANFGSTVQISIELSVQQIPRDLSRDVMTCIYRVTQESLLNVAKHARATAIQCDLKGEANGLTLTIQDNGVGFTPTSSTGLGLLGMQERARALQGRLTIDSKPGKGTTIDLWLPVSENSAC